MSSSYSVKVGRRVLFRSDDLDKTKSVAEGLAHDLEVRADVRSTIRGRGWQDTRTIFSIDPDGSRISGFWDVQYIPS